jgi:hypothetical protein
METKRIGRVALREEEIATVKREVSEEYREMHSLTGVEAFKLAKMVSTWQYDAPDPKTDQLGSYSGSVRVEGIDVAVKLMKKYYTGYLDSWYRYSVTVSTDEFTVTDSDHSAMIKEIYEQLDEEHNELLKELRRSAEPDTDNNAVKYTRTIKGYLNSDNKE